MTEVKKGDVNVVFWHNDFNNTPGRNGFYGENGPIFRRVLANLPVGTDLDWHFHGGFINHERPILLKRLRQADVLIAGCPWNMDINDNNMHWEEAQFSLLNILNEIKKENTKLKVFFLQPVFSEETSKALFEEIGEFVKDIHNQVIYDYFLGK